jgi:hypothetical protein
MVDRQASAKLWAGRAGERLFVMFDIVTSWSVLTHLRRDVQLDWLKEMSRIIAPGGLFSASVSGESLLNLPPLKDSWR